MLAIFEGVPFEDFEKAEATLTELNVDDQTPFAETLAFVLTRVPFPSRVLVRFAHLLGRLAETDAEREYIARDRAYAEMIATAFAQSQYLTDILLRTPSYLAWLWREHFLYNSPTRNTLIEEAIHCTREVEGLDQKRDALRVFKHKHMLRIGLRDVFVHAPLQEIVLDLSILADAALEASLILAREELESRHGLPHMVDESGIPQAAPFCVIAMGKLGGLELNFSSDIDLIFLYGGEGTTTGGRTGPIANSEYFNRFGEHVIKTISEPTKDGRVFRVDMRLRPHGRMGPLTVGLDNALDYYERYGQAWERQALVKARCCAGDSALGELFIKQTRRYVYPKHYDDDMLEDIREMKRQAEAQIESRGQREIEVKLGRGGIRDIEFTVQMLQMLYGGRMTSLQTANTLLAIQALEVNEILRHFEAGTLVSNYIFLRTVEHRLQIEASAQVHALPADPPALEEFAQRLGYADADTFMSEYRFRAEATREILERFLHLKGDGMLWISDLLNPLSDGASSLPKLSEVGFKEARRAREEILLLSTGSSARPHTSHVRQQFNRIAPALIKALSGASDPDVTLSRLSRIIGNLRAPSAIYDILRWNPVLCEYLVQVVSNSRMLAEYLTRDPGLFETFGASGSLDDPTTEARLTEQLSELLRAHDPRAAIYRLKDGETLRIGLRELFVSGDIFDICGELTLLAEACVRHVCTEALALTQARFGPAEGGFCVLGLGKLGGRELGYGSDLDLVFVYESTATTDKNTNATEYFSSLASNVFKLLKEPTRYGILYDIDARLRPDGRKGMLAVSDARLESYYRDDAEAWERLALVKARYVAGDPRLGQRIEERIRAIVFGEALTVDALNRIEEIRLRIVRNTTRRDLKKDEGGIAEIEFAIRLLQLRHVNQSADLMRGDVRGALEILVRNQWLNEVDAGVLGNAYTLFRRIENRIRMMDGTPGSALPEDVQQCQDLAARLGIHDELQELVARTKADVHRVYESVVASIREGLH